MQQEKRENEYNSRIIKLSYACPLRLENPNCPLKEVRGKIFTDKIKWFNSLSLPTKETIYQYHAECYAKSNVEAR